MKYCKDLQKGDLIGVSYNNYIYPAIFKGLGSAKNPNFWFIYSVLRYKNTTTGKVYTSYINRTDRVNSSPIVKLNPEQLEGQEQLDYLEVIDYLKQKGYL